MKAELKALISAEVADLKGWHPTEPDWAIGVQLLVGPAGSPGEESFDLTVCHPTWLLRDPDRKPVIGRHHLFMATYSYEMLESFLLAYVERSQDDDWRGIAEKLSRLGHWEFEDYTP